MTLSKFVSIKNIGRFQNHSTVGDVALKRFNLVFAENGRGKSTLCAILRSVQSNDPRYVTGRRTLGSADSPEVHLLTATGVVAFKSGAWSKPMPDLIIFDSTFVAENVFSGDVVDLDHRRNLYRVIIGKAGVFLAQKVIDLDAQIRTLTSTIKDKRTAISGHAPLGVDLDIFVGLAADTGIDTKIADKERELEAVRQSAQVRARASLAQITFPELPTHLSDLLQRTIEGLSATVEQRVAAHMAKHEMRGTGEAWLQQGLGYVKDGSCPFCDQPLEGVSVVPSLSAFFSGAYEELKAEIAGTREQIATAFSDRAIGEAERLLEANVGGVEFWARYCNIVTPVLSSPQGVGRPIRELRDAALSLLDSKAAAPLEIVRIDQRFSNAATIAAALRASVNEYNEAVGSTQAVIADKKKSLADANVDQTRSELLHLQAIKARQRPEVIKTCDEYSAALKRKEQLEAQKEEARKKLDEHTNTVVSTYEVTINKLLTNFQTGFRITGTQHAYPGGVPSSSFQILINDVAVDLGDPKTALDEPSFRNTLSAGDKGTLALAFFLAQVEHDPDKANRIVIFDDPFSSQDSFRKEHTVQQIRKFGEVCSQVIVLSHDRAFLHRLHDHINSRGLEAKCLQLARMGDRLTRILPWDIEEATQTQYQAGLNVLSIFYNLAEGVPVEVSAKMRSVLETYCRMLYPGLFDKDDTLGTICEKIRKAGPSHELAVHYDDIEGINEYSRDHHHGEKPGVPTSYIDTTELQGYVERTLRIIGYC